MWPGIDENTRARRDLAKYAFMLDIGVHAIRSLINVLILNISNCPSTVHYGSPWGRGSGGFAESSVSVRSVQEKSASMYVGMQECIKDCSTNPASEHTD